MKYSIPIGIFIIVAGLVVFITSFFSQTLELQIALSIASLGLIASGIIQLGQVQEKKQDKKEADERYRQIIDRLEKIDSELEKQGQPKNTGIAIADFLNAGIKYYTEHKQDKEENDD